MWAILSTPTSKQAWINKPPWSGLCLTVQPHVPCILLAPYTPTPLKCRQPPLTYWCLHCLILCPNTPPTLHVWLTSQCKCSFSWNSLFSLSLHTNTHTHPLTPTHQGYMSLHWMPRMLFQPPSKHPSIYAAISDLSASPHRMRLYVRQHHILSLPICPIPRTGPGTQ